MIEASSWRNQAGTARASESRLMASSWATRVWTCWLTRSKSLVDAASASFDFLTLALACSWVSTSPLIGWWTKKNTAAAIAPSAAMPAAIAFDPLLEVRTPFFFSRSRLILIIGSPGLCHRAQRQAEGDHRLRRVCAQVALIELGIDLHALPRVD